MWSRLMFQACGSGHCLSLIAKACGFFVCLAVLPFTAQAAAKAYPLQPLEVRQFSSLPPASTAKVVPSFAEKRFPLKDAYNLKEVEDRLGKLSGAQRDFLEKHRFLLLQDRDIEGLEGLNKYSEMLYNFDLIGGGFSASNRVPGSTVFAGPDVFLHALHSYFSVRLKNLEQGTLSKHLYDYLRGMYANIKSLRGEAGQDAKAAWERLQAQMLVPLILMQDCIFPGGISESSEERLESLHGYSFNEEERDKEKARREKFSKLENALELFAPYSKDFSKPVADAIVQELTLIYEAEGQYPSPLGLAPAYPSEMIDYTQFKPRGYYEGNTLLQAYFRAMIRLGQLGWNLESESGLADALNFALAMSRPLAGQEPSIRGAWREVMEITALFSGAPDAATYPEWQGFIREYGKTGELSADSVSDAGLLQRLKDNADKLTVAGGAYFGLYTPPATKVLCVLPQRFSLPWLLGDRLSYKDGVESQKRMPVLFSGLWVPAVFGSGYARELTAEQAKLCLAGQATATPDAVALETPAAQVPQQKLDEAVQQLNAAMNALASGLTKSGEASWFASFASSWLHILSGLTAEYGEGYPLYMQDPAFRVKQLESFLGSFTELKHDNLLYEKPNFSELGGGDDEVSLPVPKGFVEPNLDFWHKLLRFTVFLEDGLKSRNLFPRDWDQEYGILSAFRKDVALCLAIAEKELAGTPVSDEEYETLRQMQLGYMAAPLDSMMTMSDEETRSALIVDVQTINLNDPEAQPLILYEATGRPQWMLVLVGNENTPRIAVGVAYNHYEFAAPYGERLTDSAWKLRVYPELQSEDEEWERKATPAVNLPKKPFWYAPLIP